LARVRAKIKIKCRQMGSWILKTLVGGRGDACDVSKLLLKSNFIKNITKTWRPALAWTAEAVGGVVPTRINAIGCVTIAQSVDDAKNGVAMLGRSDEGKNKQIHAWLDSGANETMFKENISIAVNLRNSNMRIDTAHRGDSMGSTKTGRVALINKDGDAVGGFDNVLFVEGLTENLASVGRITDCNLTVIFTKSGSFIYKDCRVLGDVLHAEPRDMKTGLYPLTLSLESSKGNATAYSIIIRESWVAVAGAILAKSRRAKTTKRRSARLLRDQRDLLPELADIGVLAELGRSHPNPDLKEVEIWHARCGHIGFKDLKRICDSVGVKISEKFKCKDCVGGKIHRQPHKFLHGMSKPEYKPGEFLFTDLMGPYAYSLGGNKYAQVFKDYGSNFRWVATLAKKTGSDWAIAEVLRDARARSGRMARFLQTDGDGIFTSASFEEMRRQFGFIHQMSAPGDHNTNPEIEREIRTLFEGTATALHASGAPPSFWGEALHHFVFTRNVVPVVNTETGLKSAAQILDPSARPFDVHYLLPFGVATTCYLTAEKREGGKAPYQKRSFRGVCVGYAADMPAYKIFDLQKRKIRKISFGFTFTHEGFYPFVSRCEWPVAAEEEPARFYPTRETLLDGAEFAKFHFDPAEEEEVLGDRDIFTITLAEEKGAYPGLGAVLGTSEAKGLREIEEKKHELPHFADVGSPEKGGVSPDISDEEPMEGYGAHEVSQGALRGEPRERRYALREAPEKRTMFKIPDWRIPKPKADPRQEPVLRDVGVGGGGPHAWM
jgi:hypothetical protein